MKPEEAPFAAKLGLMGWPYWGPFAGHGGTIWKALLLEAGWTPNLALDGDVRAWNAAWEDELRAAKVDVLGTMESAFPILHHWATSIDWLQERGRGDVVGVMSLHTGTVIAHVCIAWREEWRDAQGSLWNWEWVIASMADNGKARTLVESHIDASGAFIDRHGRPTNKVLVRPTLTDAEQAGVASAWFSSMGDALNERHPVQTHPVIELETDWVAYEEECRRIVQECS